MQYNRRKFLQSTGLFVAGSFLAKNSLTAAGMGKLPAVGLQLYTVRDDMPKDPKGVLKQAASFGYKQIESFEDKNLGMFWGMKPAEFNNYINGLGMKLISSHCDINKDFEKKVVDASSIDMKYLICPWVGPQKSIDDFKKIADQFNTCGDICKKHGIGFAYHNHAYPFKPVDGQIPLDVMLKNTNRATVDFEMDIYWVVTGGADPEKYLRQYSDRFRLCHIKDRKKDAAPGDENASCNVGEGSINFSKILHTAQNNGVKYFIVEQERYDNTTPLQSAQADAKYLKNLII